MAWNPEQEVAIARDYGKKFNCNKVIIIGINDKKERYEIITYGKTKNECDFLNKVTGKQIDNLIQNGEIIFENGDNS